MNLFRAATVGIVLLAIGAMSRADPAPTIHYAPAENREHIDVDLIDAAKSEIDMAAYILTDWPIMQALARAADRGVKVRIYLDGSQLSSHEETKVFDDLAQTPGVEIRVKRENASPIHLKSYEIDGQLLRNRGGEFLSLRPQAPGQ